MQYLLRDIKDGVLIPFTADEFSSRLFMILVTLFSCGIDLLVICSFLKQRNIPQDSYFIISLTVADCLWSAAALLVVLPNFILNGWAIGFTGCLLNVLTIIDLMGASVCSVFAMTAYRYLVILHRYQFTQFHVYIMIALCWTLPFLLSKGFLLFTDTGTLVGLQSNLQYCFVLSESSLIANRVATGLILVFLCGTISILILAHIIIIRAYQSWQKRKEMVNAVTASAASKSQQSKHEIRLIKKSVAITGLFILSFIVIIFKLLYESTTQQIADPMVETVAQTMALFSPTMNAIILYAYDPKFRQNLREMILLDEWDKYFLAIREKTWEMVRSVAKSKFNDSGRLGDGRIINGHGDGGNQLQLFVIAPKGDGATDTIGPSLRTPGASDTVLINC